jgi:DNA-directed RNA polymerase alpha subunit
MVSKQAIWNRRRRQAVLAKRDADRRELDSLGIDEALSRRVDKLGLSTRSGNPLSNDNIIYVRDLIQRSEWELRRIPMLGPKSLNEIKEALAKIGLRLAAARSERNHPRIIIIRVGQASAAG